MENLLQSIVALQESLSDAGIPSVVIGGVAVAAWGEPRVTRDVDLLISTRPRDHEDAQSVIRRQGPSLDDDYVFDWLRQFEQALDDSTLVAEYQRLRSRFG